MDSVKNHRVTRVCVTGATGFIGAHCTKEFLRQGYEVVATMRKLDDQKVRALQQFDLNARLHVHQVDIMDYAGLCRAFRGCAGVIHVASPFSLERMTDEEAEIQLVEPAVLGTRNVFLACKELGISRIVYTSSVAAMYWGSHGISKYFADDCWSDVEFLRANNLYYPLSKTLAELEAWRLAELHKINLQVVNPCYTFGPPLCGQLNASMQMLCDILNKTVSSIPDTIGVVDVSDVAKLHVDVFKLETLESRRYLCVSSFHSRTCMQQFLEGLASGSQPFDMELPEEQKLQYKARNASSLGFKFLPSGVTLHQSFQFLKTYGHLAESKHKSWPARRLSVTLPVSELENNRMSAASALVRTLQSLGVRYVFGVPGEEVLHIIAALSSQNSEIKFVLCAHETTAGFIAAAYGRITCSLGVALSTLGPGATNFVSAAAYSTLGGWPVLFLCGQRARNHVNRVRNDFQYIQIAELFKPVSKFAAEIADPNELPFILGRAAVLACLPKQGSSVLELPEDLMEEPVEVHLPTLPSFPKTYASTEDLQTVWSCIESCKGPILFVLGARSHFGGDELRALLHIGSFYFISSQLGKGSASEESRLYLGTAATTSGGTPHLALSCAKLIVCVGIDHCEKPPFRMLPKTSCGTKQCVHICDYCTSPSEVFCFQHELIGDIRYSCEVLLGLCEKYKSQTNTNFDVLHQRVCHNIESLSACKSDMRDILTVQEIIHVMQTSLPVDTTITLDNGLYKIYFARYFVASYSNQLLLDNSFATMGAGIPTAIAKCLTEQGKRVYAVIGDGGFLMSAQELSTAVSLNLKLTVFVLCDGALGMVREKQKKLDLLTKDTTLQTINHKRIAEGYGATASKVTTREELESACKRTHAGVHIITTNIDYDASQLFLDNEAQDAEECFYSHCL
mmetsp:Transcript_17888/g.60997  ORF Transcript_17888/g.60997 Transcript_17888/m.60997 type:complete len:908 (+) Transcript_17888:218-2941(+)